MTLRDDIKKLRDEWNGGEQYLNLDAHIAAGLEREYYHVKLADLPEVTEHHGHVKVDGLPFAIEDTIEFRRRAAYRCIAALIHWESRESEALEARRDELAREVGNPHTHYVNLTLTSQAAIDRIIAEQDRAAAAEAEVARLKAAS